MKRYNFNLLPSQDWLSLRLYDLEDPYRAILSGEVTIAALEDFCGAIRFALFEFGALTRRTPGLFSGTAGVLIRLADQVLAAAAKVRHSPHRADPKWKLVLASIARHRQGLEATLKESKEAERQLARERRRLAPRLAPAWS